MTDNEAVDHRGSEAGAADIARQAWTALGGAAPGVDALHFTGEGALPSAYRTSDFAAATIGVAALAIAGLLQHRGLRTSPVTIDRRLASMWFQASIRPLGWSVPAPWDPIAGDYRARDGWIRLHTNAPHHRTAAERVLGAQADKEAMARAVAGWTKGDLEAAIVAEGGCVAEMRSAAEWAAHPQGEAVNREPLVHFAEGDRAARLDWNFDAARPLAGLRVLDLTRVLAGPVASRCLAGFGAEVLRIDPPHWDEPGVVPEVTLGKSCARLDLRSRQGRAVLEELLSGADILLHGYRPGALAGLGYDAGQRRDLAPGLVDVCLDAYGWSGPWAGRRGFDSLVQMSCGIAARGMAWRKADRPVPLPVQALDHGTGYLMAAAAIRGVTQRLVRGTGTEARLSLARSAKLLADAGTAYADQPLAPESPEDLGAAVEATSWGDARRLLPPIVIAGTPMQWNRPAMSLGSAPPRWLA